MARRVELDWLRGLLLVLMTVTHLPTWYSSHWGQPFGFVSAAEGFVFVSALLVGAVYGRMARERGMAAMSRRVWYRAAKIYAAHVGLLLFLLLFLVPVAVHRNAAAITDLASFYLAHPRTGLVGGLLLAYDPPLLDILPMYVVFLAASPFVVRGVRRFGAAPVVAGSAAVWLTAQLGLGPVLHHVLVAATGVPVPYDQTGAFSWLAWQLLWVIGLCAGLASDARPDRFRPPRSWLLLAGAVAVAGFAWRHVDGQVPGGPEWLVAALDKWHLGALRLLDFGALAVLAAAGRDVLRAAAQRSVLALMGSASLPVFCGHLALCLVALALVRDVAPATLHWQDSALLAAALAALALTAAMLRLRPRVMLAALRSFARATLAPVSAQRPARTARSPAATAHSRSR